MSSGSEADWCSILALLKRVTSPKCSAHLDRRRQIVSLLAYSPASLSFLVSTMETDASLCPLALESLLDDERGFTLDRMHAEGRWALLRSAASSRDLSRLIFARWISQNAQHDLVDTLRSCQITAFHESDHQSIIDTALRYFLDDENIRRIVTQTTKKAIGAAK